MDTTSWDDIVLHDHHHYSGEFGENVYRVRRVRTAYIGSAGLVIQGLVRSEWYDPDESGTDYHWTSFKVVY